MTQSEFISSSVCGCVGVWVWVWVCLWVWVWVCLCGCGCGCGGVINMSVVSFKCPPSLRSPSLSPLPLPLSPPLPPRHCLREALVLTNSNDLHKLTACCLVLLGQIYFSLGNKEVGNKFSSCPFLYRLFV